MSLRGKSGSIYAITSRVWVTHPVLHFQLLIWVQEPIITVTSSEDSGTNASKINGTPKSVRKTAAHCNEIWPQ